MWSNTDYLQQVGLNGTMEFIKEVIPAVPDFTIR